jgi:hypothetical protein
MISKPEVVAVGEKSAVSDRQGKGPEDATYKLVCWPLGSSTVRVRAVLSPCTIFGVAPAEIADSWADRGAALEKARAGR